MKTRVEIDLKTINLWTLFDELEERKIYVTNENNFKIIELMYSIKYEDNNANIDKLLNKLFKSTLGVSL
jgi:hypothetical protein